MYTAGWSGIASFVPYDTLSFRDNPAYIARARNWPLYPPGAGIRCSWWLLFMKSKP